MSKGLYWSVIPPEPKEVGISNLKWTLAKKIWNSDGSCGEGPTIAGDELIPFLEGIIVGNGSGDMARDAQKLINAINKHGKIHLFIQ